MEYRMFVVSSLLFLLDGTPFGRSAFAARDEVATPHHPRTVEERLEAIEARLHQLERLMSRIQPDRVEGSAPSAGPLEARLEALEQKLISIEAKEAPGPGGASAKPKEAAAVTANANGFSIRSGDENFDLKVRAHFQVDGRFFQHEAIDNSASTLAIRRARLLFEGTLARYFDFKFMPDFAGGRLVLQDAYLDTRFIPELRLRAGKMKTPFGVERLQQPVNITFIERALPNNLVPNRDVGIQLHGEIRGGLLRYATGVFNGVPDGASGDLDNLDSKDYAARIFFQPFLKTESRALKGLGLGLAVTTGIHRGTVPAANLPAYVTSGQSAFFSYRSDGTREGTSIADGRVERLSPQTYYHLGPFSLLGEYVLSSQAVRKGDARAELDQRASQIALTYVLTGEDASYLGVVPKRSLDPRARTWGAFEITGRYSELNVDREAFPLFANPSTAARKAQAWAGGLNWYFNRNVKFVLNYEQTSFKGGAALGNRPTEKAVLTRFQLTY